jgi:hypothetical protein
MKKTVKNNNFISLKDAVEMCSYSQEYLSLLARRGLLKAKKINNVWHTKESWLKKYIQKKSVQEKKEFAGEKIIVLKNNQNRKGVRNFLFFIFISLLIFFIFLLFDFSAFRDKNVPTETTVSGQTKVAGSSDKNYLKIFFEKLKSLVNEILYQESTDNKGFYEAPTISNQKEAHIFETGLVITPKEEQHLKEKMIEKIKNSFSDDVEVIPDVDSESGLVVGSQEGDEYFYVMVPVEEK